MLAFFLAKLDAPADRSTFRDFYRNHRQLMYRVAYKILKKRHLAEDAVQEAFLSILPHTAKLRGMGKGQKEGFAVVVTRNKALNLLRKERQMKQWTDLDENKLVSELEIDDSDHLFNQLPFQYAQVMKLVGLGFKPGEIAQITDREVGAVYKQISRGKELLRGILEKEGYRGY